MRSPRIPDRRVTDPPSPKALAGQIAWTEHQARQHARLVARTQPGSPARRLSERRLRVAQDVVATLKTLARVQRETCQPANISAPPSSAQGDFA